MFRGVSFDRWVIDQLEKRDEILSRLASLTDKELGRRFGLTADMVRKIRHGYVPHRVPVPTGLFEALSWRRAAEKEYSRHKIRAIADRSGMTYEEFRGYCRKLAD